MWKEMEREKRREEGNADLWLVQWGYNFGMDIGALWNCHWRRLKGEGRKEGMTICTTHNTPDSLGVFLLFDPRMDNTKNVPRESCTRVAQGGNEQKVEKGREMNAKALHFSPSGCWIVGCATNPIQSNSTNQPAITTTRAKNAKWIRAGARLRQLSIPSN